MPGQNVLCSFPDLQNLTSTSTWAIQQWLPILELKPSEKEQSFMESPYPSLASGWEAT